MSERPLHARPELASGPSAANNSSAATTNVAAASGIPALSTRTLALLALALGGLAVARLGGDQEERRRSALPCRQDR